MKNLILKSFYCAALAALPTAFAAAEQSQGVGSIGSAAFNSASNPTPQDFASIEFNIVGPSTMKTIIRPSLIPNSETKDMPDGRFGNGVATYAQTVIVQLCDKKNVTEGKQTPKGCVALYKPFEQMEGTRLGLDPRYVYRETPNYISGYVRQAANVRLDLREIISKAMKIGIKPADATLLVSYVRLTDAMIYEGPYSKPENRWKAREQTVTYTNFGHAILSYQAYATQSVDIFGSPVAKNISSNPSEQYSVMFRYIPNKKETDHYNTPGEFMLSRVTSQVFPGLLNSSVRDYLAVSIAFQMTKFEDSWIALKDLLNKEKEGGMSKPLNKNAEVQKLAKNPTILSILKEQDVTSLVEMYSLQYYQLRSQLEEEKGIARGNPPVELPDFNKVAQIQAKGTKSAQEQYYEYQLARAKSQQSMEAVRAALTLGGAAVSGGKSFMDEILR